MVEINECCGGMRTMKQDGTIISYTAFGHETGQVYMRGRNNEMTVLPSRRKWLIQELDGYKDKVGKK